MPLLHPHRHLQGRLPQLCLRRSLTTSTTNPLPLISITSSTFYAHHPSLPQHTPTTNPPLFPNLTFHLQPHHPWAILAPSTTRSLFLSLLQGTLICSPPQGRSYPSFTQRNLLPSISLVQFGSRSSGGLFGGGVDGGGYVSARYESLRGVQDVNLHKWLLDGGELNSAKPSDKDTVGREALWSIISALRLEKLMEQPVMTLSNGQVRRAKLARALLGNSEVLLVDEPFMGLDPPSMVLLSGLLEELAKPPRPQQEASEERKRNGKLRIHTTPVLALRPQDPVPGWVRNVAVLSADHKVLAMGSKEEVIKEMEEKHAVRLNTGELGQFEKEGLFGKVWGGIDASGHKNPQPSSAPRSKSTPITTTTTTTTIGDSLTPSEPLIILSNITIKYNIASAHPRYLLRDFTWRIRRGDRWGVFGPNGSGKTTLLALLTSDHPQTYSQDISHFGKRRSEPGTSVFEIQARIGQSSPEIHAFFPRHLGLRRVVESAWAETPLAKPNLTPEEQGRVEALLRYFAFALPRKSGSGGGLEGVDQSMPFGEMSISQQRLALFMRAVVKRPDLVILDEAFAGMEEEVRRRCLEWLEVGDGEAGDRGLSPEQALVVVSHVEEEVPRGVSRWVRLGVGEGEGGGGRGEFGVV